MKKIGVLSCNLYGSFTNYGTALQSWSLHQVIKRIGDYSPILIDYCPEKLENTNILNPFSSMWDKDEESRRMCELTLPKIEENYYKFEDFYSNRFKKTKKKYDRFNYNEIVEDTGITRFVCGSDTIFCINEFGLDDGFYANYSVMKNKSVSYAASFGDVDFENDITQELADRLHNFRALGIRENHMLDIVSANVDVPVKKVIDPTLLLNAEDFYPLISERIEPEKYLLLYSRRYSKEMEEYAERIAKKNNWKIVEISLRATNVDKGHRMMYEAGIEEFLSLIKHSEYVVTNSFHGTIFSVHFEKEFAVFPREKSTNKIIELLDLFELGDRLLYTGFEEYKSINYVDVKNRIEKEKKDSIDFLNKEINDYLFSKD